MLLKKHRFSALFFLSVLLFEPCVLSLKHTSQNDLAATLGWNENADMQCGGYYLEPALLYPEELYKKNSLYISSKNPTLSLKGTSTLNNVSITRRDSQILAKTGYLIRDTLSNKIKIIDLNKDVFFREPNFLVIAQNASFNLETKQQYLRDVIYRASLFESFSQLQYKTLQKPRKIESLTAWGTAKDLAQREPKIFVLQNASYTTCPPVMDNWHLSASTLKLNKNTGRGSATHATLYVKKIPVFYIPYLNFPIDSRRQTGFLFPLFGTQSKSGAYIATPFYMNLAPNYDLTITPKFLKERGLQINSVGRYLTYRSTGKVKISILPDDKAFDIFKRKSFEEFRHSNNIDTQASLRHLMNARGSRGAIGIQNDTQYDGHWSNHIDINYASDDYYLRDLGHTLNEPNNNQLLQLAEINYESQHWNLTSRIQAYQTLHPVDEKTFFNNQYAKFPQLVLNGLYPEQKYGFTYFISNDFTHFDIRHMPQIRMPTGNRFNVQPGISLPFNLPYFFMLPRFQLALTHYELSHLTPGMKSFYNRSVPIFDTLAGFYLERNTHLFGYVFKQTLEPQMYYLFVPYRNQNAFPIFDTTTKTLSYDELFTDNRFAGIDRIGDTHQISLGVSTRFLDSYSSFEKLRLAVGEIFYFNKRKVSLCTQTSINCPDTITSKNNQFNRSPITGTIDYHLTSNVTATVNSLWNTRLNEMENQSINVQYRPEPLKILNLGYSFVKNGDVQPNLPANSKQNNLKQTDLSFSWPIAHRLSIIGRWTQNINQGHFQNLLSGLQYDSCCWAVRVVYGKSFLNLRPNNSYQYDTQFYLQFALKGLTNVGTGDPAQLISSSVSGYQQSFGNEYL